MVGQGDIHLDFDTSGIALAECQSCSILVWESDILSMMLCHGRDYILIL